MVKSNTAGVIKSGSASGNRREGTEVNNTKPILIEEKSSKPPGQPKFSRRSSSPVAEPAPLTIAETITQQEKNTPAGICQQLLMDGHVQSYIDFYHLTHRINSSKDGIVVEGVPLDAVMIVPMPTDELFFIRDNLVQAEICRRQGNTAAVYVAYTRLADFYVKMKDWKTGFFFNEKCLEVAQLTNDVRAEMTANHSLGFINQLMGNFTRARVHHEKHESLAESLDIYEEAAKANVELYKVYLFLAEELEKRGAQEEALEMLNKCLIAAKKSWEKESEAEANGRLGSLLLSRGELVQCIPFLREQSTLSADLGNHESRCRACSALALAWDQLGEPTKALNELQLVNTISEQSGDIFLQAQASRSLGVLYSKIGRLDAAVEIFQRHFNLVKAILYKPVGSGGAQMSAVSEKRRQEITAADLDLARSFIGISRGNQLLGSYFVTIQYDLSALLDWKLNRSDFTKAADNILVEISKQSDKSSDPAPVEETAATTSSPKQVPSSEITQTDSNINQ